MEIESINQQDGQHVNSVKTDRIYYSPPQPCLCIKFYINSNIYTRTMDKATITTSYHIICAQKGLKGGRLIS